MTPSQLPPLPLSQLSHPKYRPEIDGLRALAILPVILFHAGFQTFSGGFVGVGVATLTRQQNLCRYYIRGAWQ
jgi:hypothetical protein